MEVFHAELQEICEIVYGMHGKVRLWWCVNYA
jgi:hypothetical protein